ncbi:MAG: hypothetical protein GXO77_13975 [Calditrichaeota bacterium]|nr:hypothetical protein [Calditrichota bacterium]
MLLKNKKAILLNILIIGIISTVTSMLLTKWYRADGLVIVPGAQNMSGLSQFFAELPVSVGISTSSEDAQRFVTLAYSREVLDSMIVKFDLLKVFDYKYRFKLRKFLREKVVTAEVNDDGSLHFGVIYPGDRNKPGEILNFLIHKVDSLYKKLKTQNAHYQRVFLETQYRKVTTELAQLEDSLANFQRRYSVLDLPEQIKSSIELIASLEADKVQSEISLQILQKNMKSNTPQIRQLKNKIDVLKDKLRKYQYSSLDSTVFKSMTETPELGLFYYRLLRDIKIREKILEFLVPQVEQAKVEEVKNTPSLLIVDPGVPAEYKSKPKRALIVILSVFTALILHIVYLLSLEYFRSKQQESPEFANLIQEIKKLTKWRSK